MYLGLYLKKPIIKVGNYPIIEKKYIKKFKSGNIEQSKKLGQIFMDKINNECGTSTFMYEYDYWNIDQCKKISTWIEKNQILISDSCLDDFFKAIYDFCKQAIELDTGVEIDL